MNNDDNLNIAAADIANNYFEDDAMEKRIGKKVRDARARLSYEQEIANRAQAERMSECIDYDAEDKDSMFYEAVVTTRDVHKEAHGVRGYIYLSHTYCNTVEEYKQAYIEAWFELRLQGTERWEHQRAVDEAVWEEHKARIEACDYPGTRWEQLKKYCVQTVWNSDDDPDEYFSSDGRFNTDRMAWELSCSSQATAIREWISF